MGAGEDEISPIVWLGHCRLWQKSMSLELASGEAGQRMDQKEGISCH